MKVNGDLVFSVVDSELNLSDIEDILPLRPSKIIVKGQKITEKFISERNIFSYTNNIKSYEDIQVVLTCFLDNLISYHEQVKSMINQYEEVKVDFYLRSDYGQMGFVLDSTHIKKLATLGLNFNVHILSFGYVED